MKYGLITTVGRNPGDDFARRGVEAVLRSIDDEAEFVLIDKERDDITRKTEGCRNVVVCGMPLFWDHGQSRCWTIKWWRPVMELDPIFAGVGSFLTWPEMTITDDLAAVIEGMAERFKGRIYARDHAVNLAGAEIPVMPCPSIFAEHPSKGALRVCNLMPDGGHYAAFNPGEAARWKCMMHDVAAILLEHTFAFAAHDAKEAALARCLGWDQDDILAGADAYRDVDAYFGNRVHGAIVSLATWARVLCCGYDSRLEAVRLLGGEVVLPSRLSLDRLRSFCELHECGPAPSGYFTETQEWFRRCLC